MSNPFLTDDPLTEPNPPQAVNIFESNDAFIAHVPNGKSNNPFITCNDDVDVKVNLFDSGINSKDIFGPAAESNGPDLFSFDDSTSEATPIIQNVGDQKNHQPISNPGLFDDPVKPNSFEDDPFGPVEPNVVPKGDAHADLAADSLRIDVSKLDFFNTKGAVSPGVSPRHSPVLEMKDFEAVPPMDVSFTSDGISDNQSEDSIELSRPDTDPFADIRTTVEEVSTVELNQSDTDLFADSCPNAQDVPSIELTGSDNTKCPVRFSESIPIAPEKAVSPESAEKEEAFVSEENEVITMDEKKEEVSKELPQQPSSFASSEAFDAFAAKFENTSFNTQNSSNVVVDDAFDPFGSSAVSNQLVDTGQQAVLGFNDNASFDPFVSTTDKPKNTPIKLVETVKDSFDDYDGTDDFTIVIKPKMRSIDATDTGANKSTPPIMPLLPPPPKVPIQRTPSESPPESPVQSRFNPFNKEPESVTETLGNEEGDKKALPRTDSTESGTLTPLYDDDISQPLEDYPPKYEGDGWEMMLRQPTKKKITGNRFWKKIFIRIKERSVLMLYNSKTDNDPFQELPLQACYSLSESGAQQYDAYGKIFTVKLQYVFYRERVGVRPGQLSKVVQGHITSVSQLAKLGLPVEHAPQVSQLLKLGSQNYKDLKVFIRCVEDSLFYLSAHRDRALQYKTEEIQVSVYDEYYAEVNKEGRVLSQLARVRLFFLAFIGGMPDVEVGLNDMVRQGREVVGRHDIIPVVTEEWIRLENCEFHSSVDVSEFEKTKTVKLHPPDACLFELMRFRIRPPRNRELPLHVKMNMSISGAKIEIRGDILVPGYHSRKHGQVSCEDIRIRVPIPECWIYLFRVEKHFRYGSLKSAHRKAGKIKGLERIMGAGISLEQSLIEVSTGQAKYEHAYSAIVWRIPRLPKEGQGAYCTHLLLCRLELTSFDHLPDTFEQYCDVEYVMPASTVSHTTVRSISVSNQNPPEKFVKYLARYEYKVEIDHNQGKGPCDYAAVTDAKKPFKTIEETDDQENQQLSPGKEAS